MEIDSNTLNKGKRDEIIKKFYRLKICKKKVRKTGGRVGNFMPQASVTLHTGIYRDPQRGTGKAYPSGAPEFTPGFKCGSCCSIFSFMCMFCRSVFVLLFFFFWPFRCLSFDLWILINPLVSSNSSLYSNLNDGRN